METSTIGIQAVKALCAKKGFVITDLEARDAYLDLPSDLRQNTLKRFMEMTEPPLSGCGWCLETSGTSCDCGLTQEEIQQAQKRNPDKAVHTIECDGWQKCNGCRAC